jgi:hypothetical protein
MFPSSLPHVIYCRCWRRWRKKRGSVILLGTGGAMKGVVVSLLDGSLLMRGYVVAAEGDNTVDGGRWRFVALPAFTAVNHESMLAVMGFVGSCVWGFVMLIWLLKSQVYCGPVEALLKTIWCDLSVAWGVAFCRRICRRGSWCDLRWCTLQSAFSRFAEFLMMNSDNFDFGDCLLWRRWTVFPSSFFYRSNRSKSLAWTLWII